MRFKIIGRRLVFYLTFEKEFEVEYEPTNIMAMDINENNVTIAVYKSVKLVYLEHIETGLSSIVIAYAEKRRRIMRGRHWSDRGVKKMLRRCSKSWPRGSVIGSLTYCERLLRG